MIQSIALVYPLALGSAVDQPNILFLLADDLRPDGIAALGDLPVNTPALDDLVEEGTVWNRAYVAGSNQGAVCSPSRGMLLTGRHFTDLPQRFAVPWRRDVEHDPPLPALWPAVLGEAGWRTFFTGKWHQPKDHFNGCFQEGSRIFFGGMGPHYGLHMFDRQEDGAYSGKGTPDPGYTSDVFADAAIESIQLAAHDERPWLTWVSFSAPHDPRTPPNDLDGSLDPADMPLPVPAWEEHPFDNGEMKVRDEKLLPWPRTAPALRQEMADYLETIEGMDRAIGRIIESLDATGQRENTIIVFLGDHGLGMGSHGLLGKQNLYDHSARTPLIMAGPGIAPGQRVDDLVMLHDLAPTLLKACGQQLPPQLGPALSSRGGAGRDVLLLQYRDIQRALVKGPWKLIVYPKARFMQCFNLQDDPKELRNRIGDPGAPVQALLDELIRRLRLANDPTADAVAGMDVKAAPEGNPVAVGAID